MLSCFPVKSIIAASVCYAMVAIVLSGNGMMPSVPQRTHPQVLIQTEQGAIRVEIDTTAAPITAINFLRYVDEGAFEEATFYRTVTMENQPNNDVKIEVIQGGLLATEGGRERMREPIVLETTEQTGLVHRDGTLSMARAAPDTATSEYFICIGDQPELDFGGARNPDGQGFAAFGRVVDGMAVVHQIHQQPADGQRLTPPIKILSVTRVK